jgi:hypothetical protein
MMEKIEGNFTFGDHMRCTESLTSAIEAFDYETVLQMSPQSFQKKLRSKHIIIADYNLPRISCDRRGLMSLNSLKEFVNIESTFPFPKLK